MQRQSDRLLRNIHAVGAGSPRLYILRQRIAENQLHSNHVVHANLEHTCDLQDHLRCRCICLRLQRSGRWYQLLCRTQGRMHSPCCRLPNCTCKLRRRLRAPQLCTRSTWCCLHRTLLPCTVQPGNGYMECRYPCDHWQLCNSLTHNGSRDCRSRCCRCSSRCAQRSQLLCTRCTCLHGHYHL